MFRVWLNFETRWRSRVFQNEKGVTFESIYNQKSLDLHTRFTPLYRYDKLSFRLVHINVIEHQ